MKIKDIMTRDPEVVAPENTLRQAAEKMQAIDTGIMPVCTNDRLVGVITDRDITLRATAEGLDPFATQVADIMTDELVTCFEDQDVEEAERIMRDKQIRRLLVLNRNKDLVGIVSLGDIAVDTGDVIEAGETLQEVSRPS